MTEQSAGYRKLACAVIARVAQEYAKHGKEADYRFLAGMDGDSLWFYLAGIEPRRESPEKLRALVSRGKFKARHYNSSGKARGRSANGR